VKTKHSYPFEVQHKGRSATIYLTPMGDEAAFTIAWHEYGKRKRAVRRDEDDAHAEAGKIVRRLAGAETRLTDDAAMIYAKALEAIRDYPDKTLADVCTEWATAAKLTHGRVIEAGTYYGQRNADATIEDKPLADAIKEFLEAKAKDVSAHYLREYDCKLNQFSEAHPAYNVAQIEPHMVDDYLRGLSVSKRTRKNARAVLLKFFAWAKVRKYSPKAHDFNESVETVKADSGAIEIYTPEELRKLLSHTQDSLVPFIAIGAFAGLRHYEIGRLDWAQVDFKRKHIEIKAQNAKTRSRRLAPLPPALAKWLKPYAKESGPVCSRENMGDALRRIAEKAEMKWKHNGLRHSFISYRVAITKDVAATSLEAGNSPTMIFKSYREVVTPKAARQWFAILPTSTPAKNVVQLHKAA